MTAASTPTPSSATEPLVPFGWDDRVLARYASIAAPGLVPGRVARVERSACVVVTATGEHLARAEPMPAVGDWVALAITSGPTGDVRVADVVERWSVLARRDPLGTTQVLAADVDLVFVTAPADRLHVARVERETAVAWDSGARPVVLVTKHDLAPPGLVEDLAHRLVGVDVMVTSAQTGEGVQAVADLLRPNRTAVLLGPSGAGKSSLVNALLHEDRMAIGAVRADDHRGRHTTTTRQLLVVPGGGVVVDTPGLRSLSLAGDAEGVAAAFPEIEAFAAECRFRDCGHDREPACAVRAAVDAGALDAARLASYQKLRRELDYEARRDDPLAQQAQRRVWRARYKALRDLPPKR